MLCNEVSLLFGETGRMERKQPLRKVEPSSQMVEYSAPNDTFRNKWDDTFKWPL